MASRVVGRKVTGRHDPSRWAPMQPTDRRLANAIRALAMDAVEAADSGHPGLPMGMADAAVGAVQPPCRNSIPADPHWPDRDRFILSAGHGSMLLYSVLYLTGYKQPTIEDIEHFRQLGSPVRRASRKLRDAGDRNVSARPAWPGRRQCGRHGDRRASFERASTATIWSTITPWCIAGDGCLMEGINHEAVGLAGHLKLGRLILMWDDNRITIDGPTDCVAQREYARAVRRRAAGTRSNAMASTPRMSSRALDRGQGRSAAEPGPLPHDHRLWCARQTGHRRCPWLRRWAPKKSPRPATCSTGMFQPFEIPDDVRQGRGWPSASAAPRRARDLGACVSGASEKKEDFLGEAGGQAR